MFDPPARTVPLVKQEVLGLCGPRVESDHDIGVAPGTVLWRSSRAESGVCLRLASPRTPDKRGAVAKAESTNLKVMTRENMEVMLSDMGIDATCVSEGACEVETARNLGVNSTVI